MRMGINLLAGETLELVNINTDTIIFTLINTLIIFLLYFFFLHIVSFFSYPGNIFFLPVP